MVFPDKISKRYTGKHARFQIDISVRILDTVPCGNGHFNAPGGYRVEGDILLGALFYLQQHVGALEHIAYCLVRAAALVQFAVPLGLCGNVQPYTGYDIAVHRAVEQGVYVSVSIACEVDLPAARAGLIAVGVLHGYLNAVDVAVSACVRGVAEIRIRLCGDLLHAGAKLSGCGLSELHTVDVAVGEVIPAAAYVSVDPVAVVDPHHYIAVDSFQLNDAAWILLQVYRLDRYLGSAGKLALDSELGVVAELLGSQGHGKLRLVAFVAAVRHGIVRPVVVDHYAERPVRHVAVLGENVGLIYPTGYLHAGIAIHYTILQEIHRYSVPARRIPCADDGGVYRLRRCRKLHDERRRNCHHSSHRSGHDSSYFHNTPPDDHACCYANCIITHIWHDLVCRAALF